MNVFDSFPSHDFPSHDAAAHGGTSPPTALPGIPSAAHGVSARQRRQLTHMFKALSDETRRQILQLLEREEHTVGQIVDEFELSQPTISRHLSVLRRAGLVTDTRHGQRVIYAIDHDGLARSMQSFFGQFRGCSHLLQDAAEDGQGADEAPASATVGGSWGG